MQMYKGFSDTLVAAAAETIDPSLQDFENKFAPIPKPPNDKWLTLLLDLVTIGAVMIIGPYFNNCKCRLSLSLCLVPSFTDHANRKDVSKMPYFVKHASTKDNLKDASIALTWSSSGIAKDMRSSSGQR